MFHRFDWRLMMTTAQVEQDNIELVKRGYDAFATGDMATLQGLYHVDATFSTVPAQTGDGNYRGRDAIFGFFGKIFEESKGTFKAEPLTIAAADDHVFVLQNVSGERNGYSLNDARVMVFTIEGGLVREMREFVLPASDTRAFWNA
jgi:ketosteroid isomerase-like protein